MKSIYPPNVKVPPQQPVPDPEPMLVGGTHLTLEETQILQTVLLLWLFRPFCSHFSYLSWATKRQGPPALKRGLVERTQISKTPRFSLPATIIVNQRTLTLPALIDCGCEQNLVDTELVNQAGIEVEPLDSPCSVLVLDGKKLQQITQRQTYGIVIVR
ncbi:hypothetical protein AMECASPLE_026049 [Ameca splendens]|uniref:Peptidase A2 domain-containing protein n=1 Tax=Ameca splendens TaxID=208324 RepID=A0ABV0Y4N5_9TELE